ncbi:hypothetical protein J3R74_004271 [Puniceicoccus vermicola]
MRPMTEPTIRYTNFLPNFRQFPTERNGDSRFDVSHIRKLGAEATQPQKASSRL